MTVSSTLERFNNCISSTTMLLLNNNALHQIFVNLYNLNVGTFTLADHESNANAFLVIYSNFLLITNMGENKVIRLYNSRTRRAVKSFTTKPTRRLDLKPKQELRCG